MNIIDYFTVDFFSKLNLLVWMALIVVVGLKSYVFDLVVLMLIAWTAESLIDYEVIPDHLPDIVFIFIVILLVSMMSLKRTASSKPIKSPCLLPFLTFIGICIISAIFNDIAFLRVILFLRHIIIFYLLLFALVNSDLRELEVKKINKFLIFIFMLQVVVASLKWIFYDGQGISFGGESLTGTYATHGGEFHTLLPLLAIGFIIPAYFVTSKKIYLGIFWSFVWFTLIGAKRASFFTLPLFALYVLHIMRAKYLIKLNFTKIIVVIISVFLTIILISKLNNTLNIEDEIGGSIDINYIISYAKKYTTGYTVVEGNTYAGGRFAATETLTHYMFEKDLLSLLLGLGPGVALRTGLVENKYNSSFMSIGIEDGITGLIWMTFQVGILGTFFFIYIFYGFYRRIYKLYRNCEDKYWQIFLIGVLVSFGVLAFDFVAYSITFMTSEALLVTFYYFISAAFLSESFSNCHTVSEPAQFSISNLAPRSPLRLKPR